MIRQSNFQHPQMQALYARFAMQEYKKGNNLKRGSTRQKASEHLFFAAIRESDARYTDACRART